MQCHPVTVSLEVRLPDSRLVILELDKTCNPDHTAEWKLHFELQDTSSSDTPVSIVKLDVDIEKDDHLAAEATAAKGLDANQRAQAAIAADTAKAVASGSATQADLEQDAAAIIPARESRS
jgi:hypothetical protein